MNRDLRSRYAIPSHLPLPLLPSRMMGREEGIAKIRKWIDRMGEEGWDGTAGNAVQAECFEGVAQPKDVILIKKLVQISI
jgi:hypothetical protein